MKLDLEIVLFSEEEIQKESIFISKLTQEASQRGITLVTLSVDFSKEELQMAIPDIEQQKRSLVIVTTQEQWEAAQVLQVAALPYIKKDSGQSFLGAWMVAEGLEEIDVDFLRKIYQRCHHLPWTILHTKRCYLREICMEDMEELFALYAKPGVTDYMEGLYPWEEEKEYQKAYIEKMYGIFGFGMWLVCDAQTHAIIGRAGIEVRDFDAYFDADIIRQMPHGEGGYQLEMGYMIEPKRQRQGLAFEICKELLCYAKENLDYASINCMIHKENQPSIRLVQKLGMELMPVEGVDHMLWYTCNLRGNKI